MPNVPPQETGQEPYDFERELHELVCWNAPRVFAVVATYDVGGPGEDARVVAWGLARQGRADVFAVDSARAFRLASPERAVRYFQPEEDRCGVRLVWLDEDGGDAWTLTAA
ncbi:hypothetical protein AB0910_29590 [Streptomyces sp. NPDC047002]|uniref:hypothetical protein n=1 Tax=Streptomyces sp. NPDC047002 TaxID=3155475 RepID=UPI003454E4DB